MLELTDSWYSIKAQIDIPLTDLVRQGQITVGQKLCMSGAELVGAEDACSPLEVINEPVHEKTNNLGSDQV